MSEPALLVSPQLAAAPSYERRAIEAWLQHKKWVGVGVGFGVGDWGRGWGSGCNCFDHCVW